MAIKHRRIDVTTTAARVDWTAAGQTVPRGTLLLRNRGDGPVYLGDATVTPSTGYQLDAGEAFSADIGYGDALYAVVAAGTVVCHVLQVGGSS